jgi:hypothetical protein
MDLGDAGAILYWCEGSKNERDCRVEFVNSDPRIISLFMRYLRSKEITEARIRIRMGLHVQDDEHSCRSFWKAITGLKDSNFITTTVKEPSVSKKPLPYGTVTIRYNSLELLREIKREIEGLPERVS